jgi:hypothetical protein
VFGLHSGNGNGVADQADVGTDVALSVGERLADPILTDQRCPTVTVRI